MSLAPRFASRALAHPINDEGLRRSKVRFVHPLPCFGGRTMMSTMSTHEQVVKVAALIDELAIILVFTADATSPDPGSVFHGQSLSGAITGQPLSHRQVLSLGRYDPVTCRQVNFVSPFEIEVLPELVEGLSIEADLDMLFFAAG